MILGSWRTLVDFTFSLLVKNYFKLLAMRHVSVAANYRTGLVSSVIGSAFILQAKGYLRIIECRIWVFISISYKKQMTLVAGRRFVCAIFSYRLHDGICTAKLIYFLHKSFNKFFVCLGIHNY